MKSGHRWSLVRGRAQEFEPAGFEHLCHIPFLLDGDGDFATFPNQFLIDLALGMWDIRSRGQLRAGRVPTNQTIKNVAEWLCNALEWADARRLDPLQSDPFVIARRYESEMLSGAWSVSGKPLSGGTSNRRVGTLFQFQLWASDKGLRERIDTASRPGFWPRKEAEIGIKRPSRLAAERIGNARESRTTITLPTLAQLEQWKSKLEAAGESGATDLLIAELILSTGIRREEAAAWREDTLPLEKKDWEVPNPNAPIEEQSVLVKLRYGTKGRQYGFSHGDKIGPADRIHLPMLIALKLDAYRKNERVAAIAAALGDSRTLAGQKAIRARLVHLFLHQGTGTRYTAKQIYSFWTRERPIKGWSPHKARHWWACMHLKKRMAEHRELIQLSSKALKNNQMPPILASTSRDALSVIELEICPQLRHRSKRTTEAYLRWMFEDMRFS